MNIILAIAFPPQSYKCCMKTEVMSMKKYLFNLNRCELVYDRL